jgi:hypothetical protein
MNCTHRPNFENCPNCGDPPKPDDLVERCETVAYQAAAGFISICRDWHSPALWSRVAKAVLEAAGVERLRTDSEKLKAVIDAAEACGWNGVENSKLLTGFITGLAERAEAAEKELEAEKRVSESLRSKVIWNSLPCSGELLSRLRRAKSVDVIIRKDGVERRFQADWLKDMARAQLKPPRAEEPCSPARSQASTDEGALADRVAPSGGDSVRSDSGLLGSQVIRDLVTVVLELHYDKATWGAAEAAARLKERYR